LASGFIQWEIPKFDPYGIDTPQSTAKNVAHFLIMLAIIDFPNLGLTYNGGWCTATKTR